MKIRFFNLYLLDKQMVSFKLDHTYSMKSKNTLQNTVQSQNNQHLFTRTQIKNKHIHRRMSFTEL